MAKRFFYVCAGLLCLALAYHLGARDARAQSPGITEMASGTYELNAGDPIPMPLYSDGTPASPSECRYLVSGYTAWFGFPSPYVMEGVHVGVLGVTSGPSLEAHFWNEQGRTFAARATITVIALRADAPTPARGETWGSVKARYR